ncbi:MAG: undecaprenyldiphospho-muramoylpentapeptide beta-N-acetylglucosaminyltransferase [bacterium]
MIAGGGTGGHLFPALAVAEAFLEKDARHQILFVGSQKGLERQVLRKQGFALETIEVVSLVGKSWRKKIGSLLLVGKSLGQSWRLLRSFQPDLVLGMGGYTSGPVVLTAWAMGKRTAIHEQNVVPGLSNKILGKVVDRIFISFPETAQFFPTKKTFWTGNPVRKRFKTPPSRLPAEDEGLFTIFVFGGSQGAHRLNSSMAEALPLLADLKEKMRIIHQTGPKDYQQMKEIYGQQGWAAEVYSFLEEIEMAYARADLIICRAGASTLFELMAMGKPALLVPFPFAANDHQTLNARALVKAGAAFLVADREINGEFLSNFLRKLINDPAPLKEMGRRAASLAKLEAAQNIVEHCYELVGHG